MVRKKISALTFSGWSRIPDALDCALPEEITDVSHMFYHSLKGKDAVLDELRKLKSQPDIVVCWSMGGRLAAHAVASGVLKPKLLIIMATQPTKVEGLHDAFKASPDCFRAKFVDVMLEGDVNRDKIRVRFWLQTDEAYDQDWLYWQSFRMDCDKLDYSHMPPTLIIHGENDALVPVEHGKHFQSLIPGSRLVILPGCGHAPHMHDTRKVSELIRDEMIRVGLLDQPLEKSA